MADVSSVLSMPDDGFNFANEVVSIPLAPSLFTKDKNLDLQDLLSPPNLATLKEDLFLSESDSEKENSTTKTPTTQDNHQNIREEWYNALSLIQSSTTELVRMDTELIDKPKLMQLAEITILLVNLTISNTIE